MKPRHLPSVLVALLTSCSSEADPPAEVPTYYADIKPILDGRCISCHSEGNIGPFTLDTYDAALTARESILTQVSTGQMPPWDADPGHTEYRYDPSLSDEQIDLIERWALGGAPEGDPGAEGAPLPSIVASLSRVDLTIRMPEAYTPVKSPDEYRCFIIDWPQTDTVFVTGFDAKPGNPQIDHHVAAFLITPDNPLGEMAFDSLADLDAADDAPGYECFGGPAGESGLQIPAQQIGQWVPGQGGGDFPAGTGIEVPPGSKVVLQMHYNGTQGSDLTEVDLKLDSSVELSAAFAPWLNIKWVFGDMEIPAFEKEVVHEITADPRDFFDSFVGGVPLDDGFTIHAVMMHMHKLGVHGFVALERASGEQEVLLEISDYDFHWQRLYQLATPVDFRPGDKLTVRCEWDNSAANQDATGGEMSAPLDVNWGEGSGDEMCVANMYITEIP